jgi:hypothetical protein
MSAGEARALADHLGRECGECEAFLARETADAVDGAIDAALLRLVPPTGDAAGNDLEWARIQRRLRSRPSVWRHVGLAAAVAAAVAVVGVALRLETRPGGSQEAGTKGTAPERTSARLRFTVALPGPDAPSVERGASGAVVPPEASLLFRIETSGPAQLALIRLGEEGEVIWRGSADRAGSVDVEVDGRPAAYPLRGLAGRQRFALLAAPALDPETLATARSLLAGSAAARSPSPAVSLDVVEVTVR